MSLDAKEFDCRYTEKGKNTLDAIFGEFTPDRDRVRLARPRREHEVVMVVDYEHPEQFGRVLSTFCLWLKGQEGFENLENLMLY
jgi:hypothetical protein